MHVTSGDEWLTKSIATIGFFDGVHRGHQFLINTMKEDARKSGMLTTVITFDRHPREVLHSDYQPQLLSTFDEKRQQIESTGVDRCAVVPFTKELSELSAYDFMRTILKEQLNVYRLYIGYDHRFGHDRSKGFEDYVEYGRELGIDVVQSTAFQEDGVNISSSVIRCLLQKGDVETATKYLGRPYTITGTVVSGEQEGRKIGFPTANIHTDPHKLIPAPGAYAVEVTVEGSATLPAMMNIGTRPTYTDKAATTIEVHILDGGAQLAAEGPLAEALVRGELIEVRKDFGRESAVIAFVIDDEALFVPVKAVFHAEVLPDEGRAEAAAFFFLSRHVA
jgi:riboflavin kinase/FMN adenylyltransferase